MTSKITPAHKSSIEEAKKALTIIGTKENTFLKVELIFYDMLGIARTYGEDLTANRLLAALKHLQANEYQQTSQMFKKSSQRERVIRRFVTQLKSILSASCKNEYLVTSPS